MQPDPKERLVDPETGEMPPLSPSRRGFTLVEYDFREWQQYERELAAHLEPDDAA
jgi:hypothetical protein